MILPSIYFLVMGDLHKGAENKLFEFARQNRKEQTAAEDLLWRNLRGKKLGGLKFRRQHPLAGFIADFYCHELALVVEVDCSVHDEIGQNEYDAGRTYVLKALGIRVIRFTNEEVLTKTAWVLGEIRKQLG